LRSVAAALSPLKDLPSGDLPDWQRFFQKHYKEITPAEMQAALQIAARNRNQPVIPVLLPGAHAPVDMPAFLSVRTWVDMREGYDSEGLDRLVWGITGKQPNVLAIWKDNLDKSNSLPYCRKYS